MPEIRITRTFDAPRERVFAAWTDPDVIAVWYGPAQFDAPREQIHVDLRPGGRWELTMVRRDGEGQFTIGYEILEVRAPELLVMRSDPVPYLPVPTTLRIELASDGASTTLTLTDGPMPEPGITSAQAGYEAALDKLVAHLPNNSAGPVETAGRSAS